MNRFSRWLTIISTKDEKDLSEFLIRLIEETPYEKQPELTKSLLSYKKVEAMDSAYLCEIIEKSINGCTPAEASSFLESLLSSRIIARMNIGQQNFLIDQIIDKGSGDCQINIVDQLLSSKIFRDMPSNLKGISLEQSIESSNENNIPQLIETITTSGVLDELDFYDQYALFLKLVIAHGLSSSPQLEGLISKYTQNHEELRANRLLPTERIVATSNPSKQHILMSAILTPHIWDEKARQFKNTKLLSASIYVYLDNERGKVPDEEIAEKTAGIKSALRRVLADDLKLPDDTPTDIGDYVLTATRFIGRIAEKYSQPPQLSKAPGTATAQHPTI